MNFDEAMSLIKAGAWVTRQMPSGNTLMFITRRKSVPPQWLEDYDMLPDVPRLDYFWVYIDVCGTPAPPAIWCSSLMGWEPDDRDRAATDWRIFEFPGHSES